MLPLKKSDRPPLQVSHRKTAKQSKADLVAELIARKKNAHKQYKANVFLAFSIGLLLSMVFVTMMFEWKMYDDAAEVDIAAATTMTDELMDIPVTEQPPPPPQQLIQQPNIIEVTEEEIIEEIEVDFDVEITAEETIEEMPPVELEDIREETIEEVFTIVEQQPTPPGGMKGFYEYVYGEIKYPTAALRLGVEGKVFVQFIVNSDGSLTEIEAIKGIGGGCDEEAIRVIKGSPAWTPGKQRGKPVRVRMVLPITFVIRNKN